MMKVNGKKYTIVAGHSTDHTRKEGTVLVSAIKCQKAQVLFYAYFLNTAF